MGVRCAWVLVAGVVLMASCADEPPSDIELLMAELPVAFTYVVSNEGCGEGGVEGCGADGYVSLCADQRGRMVAPSSDVRGDSTWAVDRSDGDEVLRVFGEGLELVYDSPDLVDQHDRRWERIELRDTGECN